MYLDVTDVCCLDDFRLLLTFENGEQREVKITELVPFDGVFEPLKDPQYFGQVRVEPDVGTIVWPNGADLCPDVLYERSCPVGEKNTAVRTARHECRGSEMGD